MTAPIGGSPAGTKPAPDRHEALRQAAKQLEAVFYNQLLQAMRETIPEGGVLEKSPGETMFTSMFDEQVASAAVRRNGIGEALYRQLSRFLPPDGVATEESKHGEPR